MRTAGMKPFIPEKDFPYFESFLERVGVSNGDTSSGLSHSRYKWVFFIAVVFCASLQISQREYELVCQSVFQSDVSVGVASSFSMQSPQQCCLEDQGRGTVPVDYSSASDYAL